MQFLLKGGPVLWIMLLISVVVFTLIFDTWFLLRAKKTTPLIKIEQKLSTISVIGTTMPIFGLLGTVTGMMKTFAVLSKMGQANLPALSGGISEALITTEAGLVLAILIFIAHNILSNQLDMLSHELEKKSRSSSLP